MAIQSTLKKSFLAWNVAYLIIMGGLGAWGAYDYWVTIPERERLATEWDELVLEGQAMTDRAQSGAPLTAADALRYEEIQAIQTAVFENTAPQPPAAYDRALNFWVYFIGCGVLGMPWYLWKLIAQRRVGFALNDNGDFIDDNTTYPAASITTIDMTKWMSKSKAMVTVEGVESPFVLDDYVFQDMYLLVGALAHRFHPEAWTEEAKPIKAEVDDAADADEAKPEAIEDAGPQTEETPADAE